MIAELIMVGTELLLGEVVDTNSAYLAQRLAELGVDLYYVNRVGDNRGRIAGLVKQAYQRADLVIISGGLGPTVDDLTKEAVADAFGLDLVLCPKALEEIEEYFRRLNRPMSENNKRQAYLPKGAVALSNPKGTAPGVLLELPDGKAVIMLPGVPVELKAIMEDAVIPYIRRKLGEKNRAVIYSKVLRFHGLGESAIDDIIQDILAAQTNPTIAPYAGGGEVRLRITAKAVDEEEALRLIEPVEKQLLERLGPYFYGYGDEGLETVVARLLLAQKKTVAVAESCTGGLISHKLTNVPGSSGYYMQGAVTYSNAAKTAVLGVDPELLAQFGAVSRQVAKAMAEGVRQWAGTDIGLSVTGIAGPGGGSPAKPVGLVYFGISYPGGTNTFRRQFAGDRLLVKERAALAALDILRRYLLGSLEEELED
ncbi:MAG TPA: competence/damage-inducible protein A [Firmicutes bacterium]|nr:competence/damage-inducible protein A [Bacillota bacterium]